MSATASPNETLHEAISTVDGFDGFRAAVSMGMSAADLSYQELDRRVGQVNESLGILALGEYGISLGVDELFVYDASGTPTRETPSDFTTANGVRGVFRGLSLFDRTHLDPAGDPTKTGITDSSGRIEVCFDLHVPQPLDTKRTTAIFIRNRTLVPVNKTEGPINLWSL